MIKNIVRQVLRRVFSDMSTVLRRRQASELDHRSNPRNTCTATSKDVAAGSHPVRALDMLCGGLQRRLILDIHFHDVKPVLISIHLSEGV